MEQNVVQRARAFVGATQLIREAMYFASKLTPNATVLNYIHSVPFFYKWNRRLPRNPRAPDSSINDLIFYRMIRPRSYLEKAFADKEYAKLLARGICPEIQVIETVDIFSLKGKSVADLRSWLRQYEGQRLVAKPTHTSGGILFLDRPIDDKAVAELLRNAKGDYFHLNREAVYHGLERKIIVERNIVDGRGSPDDYKFYCSRGQVLFCQLDTDRFGEHRCNIYRVPEWQQLPAKRRYPNTRLPVDPPVGLDKMIEFASRLSARFEFVRVDLYNTGGTIFFGEITFTHGAATEQFSDSLGDIMRRMVKLDTDMV